MKNAVRMLGIILVITVSQSCKKDTDNNIRDIDGNVYSSVAIGTQVWLVENLKTTRYRNGDLIGTTTPATLDITADTTPEYQWAYNGMESGVSENGRLYTWYVATDLRGVCPDSWHVPAIDEWISLYFPFGLSTGEIIGAELMEPGTTHWNRSDIMGTNTTGFTALPGGVRYGEGTFDGMNYNGVFWSSTESAYASKENALFYPIPVTSSFGSTPLSLIREKLSGLSIRCIRDSI
jgi:uncharacterized protein (TIGR02145 family)